MAGMVGNLHEVSRMAFPNSIFVEALKDVIESGCEL